ncbi:MAG: hypothetical protein ACM3SU_09215 [Acidobacteriota bacterium]
MRRHGERKRRAGWLAGGLFALFGAVATRADARAAQATATADFSGGGATETATARPKGKGIRLEILDASGRRIARADAPAPVSNAAVALQTGSIGSVGTLLEVAATGEGRTCRSVWRLRDGALARLPVLLSGNPIPDCESTAGWTSRWDETRNEPALYVRERERETPQGRLHETRAFRFVGFELREDAGRSGAEVNGVPIPEWYDARLYAKSALEALFQRYALSGLVRAPRLFFEADRERGVFAAHFSDREGEIRLPITASRPLGKDEPGVALTAGDPPVEIDVTLARGSIPQDVVVKGAGARFDTAYEPVIHWTPKRIRVYPDAEQELAAEALPGTWATERDERITIAAVSGAGAVRIGDTELSLRLEGAPEGTDLLLLPRDTGAAAWALTLRGPNALLRVPVRCAPGGPAGSDCRIAGESQAFRRVGSQLNVR